MPNLNLDKQPTAREEGGEGLARLHQVVKAAIDIGASDIHLQPEGDALRVRYRVDGLLRDSPTQFPVQQEASILAALINLTETMKIDEHRLPMDGRVLVQYGGKRYDLRINVIPVQTGDNDSIARRSASVRILSKEQVSGGLASLGFTPEAVATIRGITTNPHGMLLVTGPTGSGKSTTLASILRELNQPTKKLITIEDPVEYTIPGIEQIEVNVKRELTFATALRAILRRDPDIIMVGEIRDVETAHTAIHASLTGHLVFSTMHTNDAPSATERLIDLEVEHFLLADILVGVLAQRLVRRICPKCKEKRELTTDEIERLASFTAGDQVPTLWRGKGCRDCHMTGYKGRIAIYELLVVDPELIRLIARRATLLEIREAAAKAGMKTMYDDGIKKALEGLTTIEEVLANARHNV
jgi:type II secretory ATPase GspE/PulE/Tfp pilus assembly ATPase PilB-like protein